MKQFNVILYKRICIAVFVAVLIPSVALSKQKSCYDSVTYVQPMQQKTKRALYVLVDETVPLTDHMKKKVRLLLSDWGKPGDMIKIARFSASYRNLYPELVFHQKIEMDPSDRYMFNLSYKDKKMVKACLESQRQNFKNEFDMQLVKSLKNINPKIPKSELLGSLKLLSKQLYLPDEAEEKVVFLISDGMENSEVASFYAKGKVRKVDARKEISQVRRKGMIGYWKHSKVYVYGLGLMPDDKSYAKPDVIHKLSRFWEQYFVESGGKVKAIGTPELLLTSVE